MIFIVMSVIIIALIYCVWDFNRAVARTGLIVGLCIFLTSNLYAQEIPIIPNLQRTNVGGAWTKTLTGTINFNVDVISIQSMNKTIPATWNPTQAKDIPFPWPNNYIVWGQPFSAYTFSQNMIALSKLFSTEGMSPRISASISYLIGQLDAYTDTQGRIFYSFAYPLANKTLIPPWHSTLANSQAMQGLLELWKATNDIQYLTKARFLRAPLLLTGGVNTPLTMVDSASWLWFEEYPPLDGVSTHVLNGHVITMMGLYRDRQLTGDTTMDDYIRAGIATATRYYWQARRPGDIIRYWIYDYDMPDYGPLRAINFVTTMNAILPNPKLNELKDALFTDMNIEK